MRQDPSEFTTEFAAAVRAAGLQVPDGADLDPTRVQTGIQYVGQLAYFFGGDDVTLALQGPTTFAQLAASITQALETAAANAHVTLSNPGFVAACAHADHGIQGWHGEFRAAFDQALADTTSHQNETAHHAPDTIGAMSDQVDSAVASYVEGMAITQEALRGLGYMAVCWATGHEDNDVWHGQWGPDAAAADAELGSHVRQNPEHAMPSAVLPCKHEQIEAHLTQLRGQMMMEAVR